MFTPNGLFTVPVNKANPSGLWNRAKATSRTAGIGKLFKDGSGLPRLAGLTAWKAPERQMLSPLSNQLILVEIRA